MHRSLCLLVVLCTSAAFAGEPQLVSVRKIWDQAPHNAFTDLIRFQDRWFCVFREGKAHVSPDGALRVITSKDGKSWESAAKLTDPKADLRDAKITLTSDGRLQLSGAGALHPPADYKHQTMVWFSQDGHKWTQAQPVGERDYWMWRIVWHKQAAYGVGYSTAGKGDVKLYRSESGRDFETVTTLFDHGRPNEAALVFLPDDTAVCLLRREAETKSAQLGTARPPYKDWKWQDLGAQIGGPQMIRLPDGRLVAGTRRYDGGARTSLSWVDTKSGKLTEFLKLPSGGDTSYPGLVWHDGLLWVSYYSSHEGKTSIYLAQVKLD